jgi:hypothetical protein
MSSTDQPRLTRDVELRSTSPLAVASDAAIRASRSIRRRSWISMRNLFQSHTKKEPTAPKSTTSRGTAKGHGVLISEEFTSFTARRLDKLEIFSPAYYREMNAGQNKTMREPSRHAVRQSTRQAVQVFEPDTVARALGAESGIPPPHNETSHGDTHTLAADLGSMTILVNSGGSPFAKAIAEDLARDFREIGVEVSVGNESVDPGSIGATTLVVAPQEFFLLGRGVEWIRDPFLRGTFVYNTEQLQTPEFAQALSWVLGAKGVLDLCPQVPPILRPAGIPAIHIEPSLRYPTKWLLDDDHSHPLVQSLPASFRASQETSWSDRPFDISFFGNESPRRGDLMSIYAARFAEYQNFIYYTRSPSPADTGPLDRIARHVATQSRIVLNIHPDEFSYFDWHRIVGQGMASRSVVVTDHCLPHPVYKPGLHFLQTEAHHIPDLIDWVLRDAEGRATAQQVLANVDQIASDPLRVPNGATAALRFLLNWSKQGEDGGA